jgi:transketolase
MKNTIKDIETLSSKIRKHALSMTHNGQSSHIGSILSCADILAVLYGHILNVNPDDPSYSDRDRFILSKGHAGAGVYAALAESGFFDPNELKNHYQNGSIFSGHVSHKGVPGVELSTGSLGHGLGVACGISLSAKINQKYFKSFVVMSDGELDEGSIWEAVMFAAHFKLDNLIAIIDCNKLQSLDTTKNTMNLESLDEKWKSFNWDVARVDGHNIKELVFELTKSRDSEKPLCVICDTVKGKGVSFMENQVLWHYRPPSKEDLDTALKEIDKK